MAGHQADESKELERVLSDGSAAPIRLSYRFLSLITKNFSADRKIGSGGFGVVYKGVLKNWAIAIKKLHGVNDLDDKLLMGEIGILRSVKHKNIVRCVGYCMDREVDLMEYNGKLVQIDRPNKLLCFEFVPNGDLKEYLNKEKPNKDVWQRQYDLIKGICDGLKKLHDKKIIHMDMKPENILLDADMIPKITDFGLSRLMDEGKTTVVSENLCGTRGYLPPESIDNGQISLSSDIYALGIIMMELLTGQKPFHSDNGNKSLDDYGEQVKRCIEMALTCSDPNKRKRPTIQEIVEKLNELAPPVVRGTTINQMMSTKATENNETNKELLDVYPADYLPFFRTNKLIASPLRLTNKTDGEVAFRLLLDPESHIDDSSELRGILPPRSTRTYLLQMEKQPPASLDKFIIILQCCMALEYISIDDLDDNFSSETLDRNELHEVALMAIMCDQAAGQTPEEQSIPPGMLTQVVCRVDESEQIVTIDVHPTEPWILACHHDGHVTIWDYETQERVMDWKIPNSAALRSAAFLAREQWLMAGDWDGEIHVRACTTKEEVKTFKAHDSCVVSLATHPSKPLMLSASTNGTIRLWDWSDDWKRIRTFKAHDGYVEKVMFNPMDSNFFASVGQDGLLKIWKTMSALCVKSLDCQQGNQLSADYFQPAGADRQYMITGSWSGKARIWDLKTNTCIRTIEGVQGGHGCNVGVVNDCLPDRQLLVIALEGNVVSLYNFHTQRFDNMIDFKLGRARTFAYVEAIKSVVIGFEGGIAMMEIN